MGRSNWFKIWRTLLYSGTHADYESNPNLEFNVRIGIACHSVYGGSSVVASELGLALAKRGHDVHFISFSLPFRLESYQSHVYFHEIERMSYPLFPSPEWVDIGGSATSAPDEYFPSFAIISTRCHALQAPYEACPSLLLSSLA